MGIGALDYKKGGESLEINGIIEDYYVYAGESVNTGDFVEFVQGVASQKIETSKVSVVDNTYAYAYACKIDEKRVFLAELCSNTPKFVGRVLTFDGTKISVGDTYTILSNISQYSEAYVNMKLLDEDKIIIAYSGYATSAVICMISGSEITVGTHLTIGAGSSSYPDIGNQLGVIDKSTVLLCWCRDRNSTSSTYGLKAVILNISGTTITANMTTNISTPNGGSLEYLSMSMMSKTKAMLFYRDVNNNSQGQSLVFTISGTKVTASSNKYTFYAGDLNNSGSLNSLPINSTQAILVYPVSGGWGVIATLSGDTISFGNAVNFRASQCNEICISYVSEKDLTRVMVAYYYGGAGGHYTQILSASGTSVGYGTAYLLPQSSSSTSNLRNFSLANIDENVVANISAYRDSAGNVVDAQLLGADGLKISNNVVTSTYETQVKRATTLPCNGLAKTVGIGGTSSGHNEQVSIYVPNI